MQPPIPIGTILQNRYRLLKILGQGGFGRTYLAADQGRFEEPCVIKELIPAQSSPQIIAKAQELFQREAVTLYQIQHPQIPQFRANFEQNQGLFLVQDYVEGKNYGLLLSDRQALGQTFAEAEVRQLLQQLLPVLAYIHRQGIIHRDISPDNIILRQSDRLPILIDFGAIAEIATCAQNPDGTIAPGTHIGKVGYTPSEQLQTGKAYPSSDLYALAVTAVVLLTGKEPQQLFDDAQSTWRWQQFTPVSTELAQVLNRMLSYRPSDRFLSAEEALHALQTISIPPIPGGTTQAHTIAVGRNPVAPNPNRPKAVIHPPANSRGQDLTAIIPVGIALAILAGLGSWVVVTMLLNKDRPQVVVSPTISPSVTPLPSISLTPTITPSPIVSAPPTPIPSPTPSPVTINKPVNLSTNKFTEQGKLKANETINYIIAAEKGQRLNVYISGEGVLLTVLGADQKPVSDRARRVSLWEGTLSNTGLYIIEVKTVQGLPASNYKLDLSLISPAPPTPSPTVTLTPTTKPSNVEFDIQKINLVTPTDQVKMPGKTSPQKIKRYLVKAQEGQIMTVGVEEGNVKFNVRYPSGEKVEDATGVGLWQAQLPSSGEYQIDVIAPQETNFTLSIGVGNKTKSP